MEQKEDNKKFIECECMGEVLSLEYWDDEYSFYLCIHEHGCHQNHKLSWRQRFRWMWACLKGTPFKDQMMLSEKKAKELSKFINDQLS